MSRELHAEIYRILTFRCGWTASKATTRLRELETDALNVELRHNIHVCRDPKDDMFLECAVLAGADVLVTGDKDLRSLGSYGSTRIVTPLEYVELPV